MTMFPVQKPLCCPCCRRCCRWMSIMRRTWRQRRRQVLPPPGKCPKCSHWMACPLVLLKYRDCYLRWSPPLVTNAGGRLYNGPRNSPHFSTKRFFLEWLQRLYLYTKMYTRYTSLIRWMLKKGIKEIMSVYHECEYFWDASTRSSQCILGCITSMFSNKGVNIYQDGESSANS